jgi:hypothetical protein
MVWVGILSGILITRLRLLNRCQRERKAPSNVPAQQRESKVRFQRLSVRYFAANLRRKRHAKAKTPVPIKNRDVGSASGGACP